MGSLIFNLRSDMPLGFKENSEYPELPAFVNYLSQFDGKTFDNLDLFKEHVLDKALSYLEKERIPKGKDIELRKGLKIETPEKRFISQCGDIYDFIVLTPANNGPKRCVFGRLERIN